MTDPRNKYDQADQIINSSDECIDDLEGLVHDTEINEGDDGGDWLGSDSGVEDYDDNEF